MNVVGVWATVRYSGDEIKLCHQHRWQLGEYCPSKENVCVVVVVCALVAG